MTGFRLFFYLLWFCAGTVVLAGIVSLPVTGLILLFSLRAALAAFVFFALSALGAAFFLSEWGILSMMKGGFSKASGLRSSYDMALASMDGALIRRPTLMLFSETAPNALVIRSLGGDGALLMSEGFVALLDEGELRFVLCRAIRHLTSPGTVLQSASAFGLLLIRKTSRQRADRARIEIGTFGAWAALLLWPWEKFYYSIGEALAPRVNPRSEEFIQGASKLARAASLYGQKAILPGLVYLGIER